MQKIAQRKRYIRKQKGNTISSKDDELDLLGDDVESFTGSNADLESAADNLFTSPPRPQPLPFSSLSLKTASKPGTYAVNLDIPPLRPTTNLQTEDMDVDYGPALPPGPGSDHQNFSHQNSNASEVPSKSASDGHKRHSHSHRKHDVGPRSALDQYSDESDQPRMSSTKPQKHADKSRYKSRSRYVSSSSEEDQPSVAKHRSS